MLLMLSAKSAKSQQGAIEDENQIVKRGGVTDYALS
jgi:hypothetical protein